MEEQVFWGTNNDGNILSSLHCTVQETTYFFDTDGASKQHPKVYSKTMKQSKNVVKIKENRKARAIEGNKQR